MSVILSSPLKQHSLANVGKLIRDDSFSPETHCVLSWFSTANNITFHRAIKGERAFLTPAQESHKQLYNSRGQNCLQLINVGHIVKAFVEIDNYQLLSVLAALVPDSTLMDFHLAATDTLAMGKSGIEQGSRKKYCIKSKPGIMYVLEL
jgi:hypothetical protein